MKTRILQFLLVISLTTLVIEGRPHVDEQPLKFNLDTGKEGEGSADNIEKTEVKVTTNSRFQDGMEFMSETRNNVAGAIGGANDILVKGRSTLQSYEKAPFAQLFPPRTRETVRLESENDQAFFEKKKPNPIGSLLENIFKPQPIVDNIKEEEKYGNNGDKFIGVGRALVNGFEGLSNFLNTIVDFPVKAAKNTSRGLTEALNQIGSKIIGLQ